VRNVLAQTSDETLIVAVMHIPIRTFLDNEPYQNLQNREAVDFRRAIWGGRRNCAKCACFRAFSCQRAKTRCQILETRVSFPRLHSGWGWEMAVLGYARVSTARQASEGESLDAQRRQIEGYAHTHALELAEIVVEEGVSGSVPVAERPAGGPLFARLVAGDIVIAPKLDRLFRSALDALNTVEALKTRGVRLHLLDLGGDIAGNGLSKLFLTIAATFAEAERDRIRERVGQVKADQRKRGRFLGGHKPFGFLVDDDGALVPDEREQAAIKRMVALRGRGKSLRAIAAAIAAKGGPALTHAGVAKILREADARIASSRAIAAPGRATTPSPAH